MKTKSFTTITAGIAALITPAFAIEAPVDNTPPPPAAEAPAQEAIKPDARAAGAFLGVVSAEMPEMLAEHLDLKPGEGIVVRGLMPDGPAAKAGIAVHDVITQVAGQPVNSTADLTREITSKKPGESIRIDVLHKGKPAGIDVTLGTRPKELAAMNPAPLDQLKLDGIPQDMADRVRNMIEGNLGAIELDLNDLENDIADAAPEIEEAMREMRLRMANAMADMGQAIPQVGKQIDMGGGAAIRMMDDQGSIELKSNQGGKEVTLRDTDDKVTWAGPWDTPQDKAAAPDEVRARVERLNLDMKFEGNGLRLNFNGVKPGNQDD